MLTLLAYVEDWPRIPLKNDLFFPGFHFNLADLTVYRVFCPALTPDSKKQISLNMD
jgi:hypothetical protein